MASRYRDLHINYQLLELELPTGEELRAYVVPDLSRPHGDVLLAINQLGEHHVLIPVGPADEIRTDEQSTGIHLVRYDLRQGATHRRFINIKCSQRHLFDIFHVIAAEMLDAIALSDQPPDVVALGVLERWRELLKPDRGKAPGPDKLATIYGELLALRELVTLDRGAAALWTGPQGNRHDLSNGLHALEVKVTRSQSGWRCRIQDIRQLEEPFEGSLHLVVYRLENLPEGQSVPELFEEIVLLGADKGPLMHKLHAAGLAPQFFEEVKGIRFHCLESRTWRVDDAFPRVIPASLVGGDLGDGVSDLVYTIDPTASSSEALTVEAEGAMRRRLVPQVP